jgi:hypothetical protein
MLTIIVHSYLITLLLIVSSIMSSETHNIGGLRRVRLPLPLKFPERFGRFIPVHDRHGDVHKYQLEFGVAAA